MINERAQPGGGGASRRRLLVGLTSPADTRSASTNTHCGFMRNCSAAAGSVSQHTLCRCVPVVPVPPLSPQRRSDDQPLPVSAGCGAGTFAGYPAVAMKSSR